ncbi:hypothetical protein [uncultured Paludibaculum sp.]|uniref:hypothetical protein n=1 Tax=uncultured Paludibaculum sp. TaxID=1765020 RepID=UPI002AAAD88D|nr:hypothetical protein [uncultured Paludibaculum sp.]
MPRVLSRRTFVAASALSCLPLEASEKTLCGVTLEIIRHGRSRRRYLRIHGDETTAAQALREHLRTARGTGFLVTNPKRNITIAGGLLDPNRMFSREGAERSYRRLNPKWTDTELPPALAWLDRERPKLIHTLLPPKGGLLFAVHNNARGYSMEEEIPISQQTALPHRDTPHEFFLVTDPADYARMAQGPYNVLLQNEPKGEDDGSLSRLCGRLGVRYVNLEVGIGKLAVQKEMMAWLERTLPE